MEATQILGTAREVESIIGYTFTDPFTLWEALQAAGSGNTSAGLRRFPNGNKRLAVLGDTILQLVLVKDWYDSTDARGLPKFRPFTCLLSDRGVGQASEITQRVASNANLDRTGRYHGLDDFICRNPARNPAQPGYISPKTMADTVEAILGALYLDGGIDHVRQVMQTLGLVPRDLSWWDL